jgi:hypothetical protein
MRATLQEMDGEKVKGRFWILELREGLGKGFL